MARNIVTVTEVILGLKIKQTADYVNEYGLGDGTVTFSIASVVFDYKAFSITIEWELTPSTWIEGTPKQVKCQLIPLSELGQEELGLLLAVSDALHIKANSVEFMPSIGGILKSFEDFNATTVDVGMP